MGDLVSASLDSTCVQAWDDQLRVSPRTLAGRCGGRRVCSRCRGWSCTRRSAGIPGSTGCRAGIWPGSTGWAGGPWPWRCPLRGPGRGRSFPRVSPVWTGIKRRSTGSCGPILMPRASSGTPPSGSLTGWWPSMTGTASPIRWSGPASRAASRRSGSRRDAGRRRCSSRRPTGPGRTPGRFRRRLHRPGRGPHPVLHVRVPAVLLW
jgi:hypothetical protein